MPGNDLGAITTTSANDCYQACCSSACNAWVWNPANNQCYPKTSSGSPSAYAGLVGGIMANWNINQCIDSCAGQGYKLATQRAGACYCGNTISGSQVATSSCDAACTSTPLYPNGCGGAGSCVYSIFYTGYLGCYADQSVRDFSFKAPYPIGNNPDARAWTVNDCRIYCSGGGFRYAALQDSGQCFCGQTYGKYGTSTGCTSTCVAKPDTKCGGSYANSVYTHEVVTCVPGSDSCITANAQIVYDTLTFQNY